MRLILLGLLFSFPLLANELNKLTPDGVYGWGVEGLSLQDKFSVSGLQGSTWNSLVTGSYLSANDYPRKDELSLKFRIENIGVEDSGKLGIYYTKFRDGKVFEYGYVNKIVYRYEKSILGLHQYGVSLNPGSNFTEPSMLESCKLIENHFLACITQAGDCGQDDEVTIFYNKDKIDSLLAKEAELLSEKEKLILNVYNATWVDRYGLKEE